MSRSTSGRPDIFVFMLWIAKLKPVLLVKGTQRIKGLEKNPQHNSQESCAVTTRKPTLFDILPALVWYFPVKYSHRTSV